MSKMRLEENKKRVLNVAITGSFIIFLLGLMLLCQMAFSTREAVAETIWQEDFESPPRMNEVGSSWSCYDLNSKAYWGEESWTGSNHTTGGAWGAWCAGVNGNHVTHKYVLGMAAFATHNVDLTSYEDASVVFWYSIPSQYTTDQGGFSYGNSALGRMDYFVTPAMPGWKTTPTPINLNYYCGQEIDMSWWWYSNNLVLREGMYIDDISVTGTRAILLNSPDGGETWQGGSNKTISWTTSAGTAPFTIDLYYSTDGGLTYFLPIATGINQTTMGTAQYSWVLPAITSSLVRVKVVRTDADGKIRYDVSNNSFTIDSTPPAAPTNVTVSDAGIGGRLNLSWTKAPDVDLNHVHIYRSTTEGVLGTKVYETTNPSTTSWSDTSLTNGVTYYYTLRSVDNVGNESANTDQYSGVPTDIEVLAPTNPVPNPADWTKTNSFSVSWTNPSDHSGIVAAYYKLDSAPSSDTDGTRIAGSNISSISDITVSGSGSHAIYVWLEDGAGNINYVNRAQTTLKYDITLPTVEITNPLNNATISGTVEVEATATDISGITKIDFYVDGEYKATDSISPYTYSWNTTGLTGPHTITAKAFDGAGNEASLTHNVTIDNAAPAVSSTDPEDGATDISVGTNIKATFNEDMDPATINTSNFTLKDAQNNPVAGALSYDPATRTATFNPNDSLAYQKTYTATLTTGIKDVAGNSLVTNYSWSFTTGAQPTKPVADPGGPYKINEGKLLTLDGSASYDPEGDPLTFDWDFGDGTAHGQGEYPEHTYDDDLNGTYRTYTVTLIVNDTNTYSEAATTTVEVYVRGDVNLDGRVDIFDLVIVSKTFGLTPQDPNWDSRADINEDNQVNIFDLVLVAKDFNKIR